LELALYAHDMTAAGDGDGMVGAGVEEELHNISDYIRDSHDGPERSVSNLRKLAGEKVEEEEEEVERRLQGAGDG
jgi:hypothetical protein